MAEDQESWLRRDYRAIDDEPWYRADYSSLWRPIRWLDAVDAHGRAN
jgi:hypothetical protein